MKEQSSYRTILRSSSIVGGTQVINIAAGLVKMKVAAVLLGPEGVGLVGLYSNLMQTASSVASLGLGTVGTRQIAAANAEGGDLAVGRTRRALFWGTMVMAVIGAALFWLASGWLARTVLSDETLADDLGWLSIGVALSVAAGSQGALLTGLRRLGDLARINIGSGVIGALLSSAALWAWGTEGMVAMILIAPAITFLLGHVFVARLGPPAGARLLWPELSYEWRQMVRLGLPFMLSGLITLVGHLAARTLVQRELGAEALGQFQAAWAIGMTYLGFVLNAMGTDYYPRLTATIREPEKAVQLVNQQTEVALLLCAPVLLSMLGLAPWVIWLLYSADFGPAVDILRWQLLGDVLKVITWPLGFVILARGAGRTFMLSQAFAMGVFVLGIYIGLPLIGIAATGVSFLVLYVLYAPLVWWLGRRTIGFAWSTTVIAQAVVVFGLAVMVDVIGRWSAPWGAVAGLSSAFVLGLWTLVHLSEMTGAKGRLGRIAALGVKVKRWLNRFR